jgi:hypothetical protein
MGQAGLAGSRWNKIKAGPIDWNMHANEADLKNRDPPLLAHLQVVFLAFLINS